MHKELTTNAIGALIFGWVGQAFNVYLGPAIVALMAVIARMFYSETQITFKNFVKAWSISAFVGFIAFHLLRSKGVDVDFSLAVSGSATFLAKELLDTSTYIASRMGEYVLIKIKSGIDKIK